MRIQMLVFSLFFQSFLACQLGQENASALEATLQSSTIGKCEPDKSQPSASKLIFKSVDGGQTWQDISEGLPAGIAIRRASGEVNQVFLETEKEFKKGDDVAAANPNWEVFMPEKIFKVSKSYIYGNENGIFKEHTRVGGASAKVSRWDGDHLDLPDGVISLTQDGISKSVDGGQTWKQVFENQSVSNLYAAADGSLFGVCFRGMVRSTDGGEHWEWALTDDGAYKLITHLDGQLVVATRREGIWKVLPLHAGPILPCMTGLDKTPLSPLAEGLAPFKMIFELQQVGDHLLCIHNGGISRSTDQGKTWQLALPTPDHQRAFHFITLGQTVFAVLMVGC